MGFTISIIFALLAGLNEGILRLLSNKKAYDNSVLATYQNYCFRPSMSWRNVYNGTFTNGATASLKASGLDYIGATTFLAGFSSFEDACRSLKSWCVVFSTLALSSHCSVNHIEYFFMFAILWVFLYRLVYFLGIITFKNVINYKIFNIYCKGYFYIWKYFLIIVSSKEKRKVYKQLNFE